MSESDSETLEVLRWESDQWDRGDDDDWDDSWEDSWEYWGCSNTEYWDYWDPHWRDDDIPYHRTPDWPGLAMAALFLVWIIFR